MMKTISAATIIKHQLVLAVVSVTIALQDKYC